MKALVLALVVSLTSTIAMAREPKATQFAKVAKDAVVDVFARKGDQVSLSLVDMSNEEETSTEVWEVTLTNGTNKGSATYNVTVTLGEGQLDIQVRFVDGT